MSNWAKPQVAGIKSADALRSKLFTDIYEKISPSETAPPTVSFSPEPFHVSMRELFRLTTNRTGCVDTRTRRGTDETGANWKAEALLVTDTAPPTLNKCVNNHRCSVYETPHHREAVVVSAMDRKHQGLG